MAEDAYVNGDDTCGPGDHEDAEPSPESVLCSELKRALAKLSS
jgi:hypothetical protein